MFQREDNGVEIHFCDGILTITIQDFSFIVHFYPSGIAAHMMEIRFRNRSYLRAPTSVIEILVPSQKELFENCRQDMIENGLCL